MSTGVNIRMKTSVKKAGFAHACAVFGSAASGAQIPVSSPFMSRPLSATAHHLPEKRQLPPNQDDYARTAASPYMTRQPSAHAHLTGDERPLPPHEDEYAQAAASSRYAPPDMSAYGQQLSQELASRYGAEHLSHAPHMISMSSRSSNLPESHAHRATSPSNSHQSLHMHIREDSSDSASPSTYMPRVRVQPHERPAASFSPPENSTGPPTRDPSPDRLEPPPLALGRGTPQHIFDPSPLRGAPAYNWPLSREPYFHVDTSAVRMGALTSPAPKLLDPDLVLDSPYVG